MACIDKTYTNSYKEYLELKKWLNKKEFICPNGTKIKIYAFNWWHKEDFEEKELPVLNTSSTEDYFLIKYCPLKFVQNRLKSVYSEEYYNSVKNGTSAYDTFSKEGKYGIKIQLVKKPNRCWVSDFPIDRKYWLVQLDEPNDEYLQYDEETDKWIWKNELGNGTTNTAHFKTIKSIIRHARKWQLPKGTIINVFGRYVGNDYKFIVK